MRFNDTCLNVLVSDALKWSQVCTNQSCPFVAEFWVTVWKIAYLLIAWTRCNVSQVRIHCEGIWLSSRKSSETGYLHLNIISGRWEKDLPALAGELVPLGEVDLLVLRGFLRALGAQLKNANYGQNGKVY